ncbi:MAG TPA: sigma-70 family RNA polymerase sigma factor [Fimbriimonadaceae bacterium]|nr:sigma-70 family RNA polymerase sigma factor [Fimbriimonadaceae bacterium]
MPEKVSLHQDPEGLVLRYLKNPQPDLKDLIMVQYAPLVERIARRFSGIEPFDDLCQVGFIGLLNALSKFDPEANVRFNTYATYLVAGEIKHYLRDRAHTIRQPAWLQELRHKVNRAANVLQQTHGRSPTEREIAEELGVSENAVKEVFATQEMMKVTSLDSAPAGEDDGDSEVERLDAAAFCPEQLSFEDRMLLENAMKQLRDLERQVLIHFHFDAMNQTEIAAKLGISCNYVSHILRQSLAKLRKILANEEEKDRVLRRQAAQLDYEVLDAATGAYTEAFFRARLEEELHRASSTEASAAIVMVGFGGLETLKAFYGEASVSDFMADAADFLKDNVRRLDIVARYGESGFGIILPATGPNVALVRQRLLQRICGWMSSRFAQSSPIVVEIGQACSPDDGRSASELLQAAQLRPAAEVAAGVSKAA